ncbi:hypothetical protein K490DRAFT_49407 [Saccharata proteae CBS 121410]|uniref:LisH domain-containing protein n=1 Tax=Saccharata proteae CBS 121410 TaxID=1314787 RepID=A0A9P4HS41_9PEZI|nr:hypothetical protein K490DRAFT_49407 [Saccharata proteae CBS 121410]
MDPPEILVARFLRTNDYTETLAAFLKEADLPSDAGTVSKGDLTIEKVLQEKKTFDLSVNFEKLGISDASTGWQSPAPSTPIMLQTPTTSNILSASVEMLEANGEKAEPLVLATSADRRLHMLSPTGASFEVYRSCTSLQDSPILSYVTLGQRYLLASSMSGKIVLYDSKTDTILDERRDHSKYVVKVIAQEDAEVNWVATAGWDAKVLLYCTTTSGSGPPTLGGPMASLTLPTNPEAMLMIKHPETAKPVLILTRRDSTFLYYYSLPDPVRDASADRPGTLQLLGKQNLAPHSNAWIAFTPSSIALCPTDPFLLAVATSAVPHMKVMIVRLLVPPADAEAEVPVSTVSPGTPTQASQARAELAIQDRESAAILIHCSTLAPQTPYSTPALAWRPDGSGVWVNSDDGVVRGIERSTGKIIASLKGHEGASKIRCVWAGHVDSAGRGSEEWMISGGFDQKLILWRTEQRTD